MHPEAGKDAVQKILRNAEIISKGRASLTEEKISHWFKELEEHLNEENCSYCWMVIEYTTLMRLDEKESITVLANFSASGKVVPPIGSIFISVNLARHY
ncbi:hypothetical protein PR048_018402 [Dryococelus australis]|uniref:Uncharacterized protein n=1 Tax=Dryococelus australis TaxID=614101 RepID=A0ABQ9HCK2_9NEOP|nr:hypothetical protein PR048_018402 [Dryococelus australis]